MTYEEATRITQALNTFNAKAQSTAESSFANVMNFKDPTELNSIADAIFNTRAKNSKEWLRKIPAWANLGGILPVKEAAAMIDVVYEGGIKPLIGDSNGDGKADWDFKAVGINGLYNLMETLDLVANPVKGAIIEGFDMVGSTEGLNAAEGFSRGLGLGADGRTQYDYNETTGAGKVPDFLWNFFLEFVSDPMNLVELGAGTIAKSAGKKIGTEVLGSAAEAASKSFGRAVLDAAGSSVDEAASLIGKTMGEKTAKEFMEAASRAGVPDFVANMEEQLANAFKGSKQFQHIISQATNSTIHEGTDFLEGMQRAAKKALNNKFDEAVYATVGAVGADRSVLVGDVADAISKMSMDTVATKSRRILDAMSKVVQATDDTQKYLLKSALLSNPIGLGLSGAVAASKKLWTKYGSTQYVASVLKQTFKEKDFINMESLYSVNRFIQNARKAEAAADADIPDNIVSIMVQAGGAQELSEIYAIIARNNDPYIAQQMVGKYIRDKYGKTVTEYLDTLDTIARAADLDAETKVLYVQHQIQLKSQFEILAARENAAKYAAQARTIAADKKFFNTQLDDIWTEVDELAYQLRAYSGDTKVGAVVGTDYVEAYGLVKQKLGLLQRDPRFLKYAENSPALRRMATIDVDALTVEELQTYAKELKDAGALLNKDFAPVLQELRKLSEATASTKNIYSYVLNNPLTRAGELHDRFLGDPVIRKQLFENGYLLDIRQGKSWSMSRSVAEFADDIRNVMSNVGAAMDNARFTLDTSTAVVGMFADKTYRDILDELLSTFTKETSALPAAEIYGKAQDLRDTLKELVSDYWREHYLVRKTVDGTAKREVYEEYKVLREFEDAIMEAMDRTFTATNAKVFEAVNNMTGYVIKLGQVDAGVYLMQSDGLDELASVLVLPQGVKMLEQAIGLALTNKEVTFSEDYISLIVDEVKLYAQSHLLQKNFMNEVVNDPNVVAEAIGHDAIAMAFLDATAAHYNTGFQYLAQDPDAMVHDIFRRMMGRINGTTPKPSNKLRDVLERTFDVSSEEFKSVLRTRFHKEALTFHDADDDAIAAILIAEKQVPSSAGHVFGYDIETSESGHIIQIAWRYGDASGNYRIATAKENLFAREDIVRKLSGLDDGASYPEHYAAYVERYATGTHTEEEALREFYAVVNQLSTQDEMLRLAGHNVRFSDEVRLLERVKQYPGINPGNYGDPAYLTAHRLDTYLNVVRDSKYLDFEDEPVLRAVLTSKIRMLFEQRKIQIEQSGLGKRNLFEQPNRDLAKNLRVVANIIDPHHMSEGFARNLRDTATALLERLGDIRRSNVSMEDTIFLKDFIPQIDALTGSTGATNIMQLVGTPLEVLSGISAKIKVDPSLAKSLFNEDYAMGNILTATEYGKKIEQIYNRLTDVETLLGGRSDELKVMFDKLRAILPKEDTDKGMAIKNLKFPDSLRQQAAVTRWLMQEAKRTIRTAGEATISETLRGVLGTDVSDDLFKIFDRRYYLFGGKLNTDKYKVVEVSENALNTSARRSMAKIEATLDLEALRESQKQFLFMDDMIQQYYRFDKKYELAFAEPILESGKKLWKTVAEAAATDPELGVKLYNYYDAVCKNAASYLLSLRGDDLIAHVRYHALGLVRMDLTDWLSDKELMAKVAKFVEETKDSGLAVRVADRKLWVLTTDSTPHNKLKPPEPPAENIVFPVDIPENVLVALQESRQSIHSIKDGMRRLSDYRELKGAKKKGIMTSLYSANSTGTLISTDGLESLLADMPGELRKLWAQPIVPQNMMFNFDYSNLASPALRKAATVYAEASPLYAYSNTLEMYMAYAEGALKARLMLTSDSSLLRFSKLFDETSDEEVLEALQSSRLHRVLIPQKSDTPFGYMVREIRPQNIADIKLLRDSEAIVVDHNTHRMLKNLLNRGEITNGFIKILNNVIVSPSKAVMLSGLAPIFRNMIDSTLKNYASLGSASEAGKFTTHLFESARWLHTYNVDMKEILEITSDFFKELKRMGKADITPYGPNKQSIDAFFKGWDRVADFLGMNTGELLAKSPEEMKKLFGTLTDAQQTAIQTVAATRSMRRDMFNLIHTFIVQGPSAGYIRAQQDMMDDALEVFTENMTWDEKFKHWAWTNGFTSHMMDMQSYVEQISRFSKFTWELRNDSTVAEAMHRVIETHFDYATKSKAMLYLEVFLPFTTFAIANAEFWTRLMGRNGWAFGVLRDMYSASMELPDYNQYELQHNRSLQYALLNGTIRLNDDGLSMKLNPSYMDVYNMLTEPGEALRSRIAKAVKIPFDLFASGIAGELKFDQQLLKNVLQILPGIGIMSQRYWKSDDWKLKGSAWKAADSMKETANKLAALGLPSLFTSANRIYYFAYPSSNEVWATYDQDTYDTQLMKGAVPVITTAQAKEIEARIKRYFYYGTKQYSTYSEDVYAKHMAKGATTKPVQKKKKTYVSFRTSTVQTRRSSSRYSSGVSTRSRLMQVRPFGEALNLSYLAPALWRRIYNSSGKDKFKSRLTPTTAKNLRYKVRTSWRYWR